MTGRGILVVAGVNGAGKSSIAGRVLGGAYTNPDVDASALRASNPSLSLTQANAHAWQNNLARLRAAIDSGHRYAFETTLGGRTIPAELRRAAEAGVEVRIWYVGLDSVNRHLARIARRVRGGGHPIPDEKVRERYETSLRNLVALVPYLAELVVIDNSVDADADGNGARRRTLIRHRRGRKPQMVDLKTMPNWAKPIAAAVLSR